jgi:hypothetical protein
MARQDLLALTPDDLIALSNRGVVKRAQRDSDSGETAVQVEEDAAGNVLARWPDGAVCRISPHEALSGRCCTCPATTVCRHLVGAILDYQRQQRLVAAQNRTQNQSPAEPQSWDPGAISDEALASSFTARQLAALRQQFEGGLVVELHRGPRPRARLHNLAHSIRFLVAGNPHYTRCDCADPAPCGHVPLSVWAFRLLPAGRASGLVSTAREIVAAPSQLLDNLDQALEQVFDHGIAELPDPLARRLARIENECRRADMVWLAEILLELIEQRRQYETHDARFSPAQAATLIGELVIRADAARFPQPTVPPTFIRGSSSECTAQMGNSRLIGLGTSVELRRGSVVLAACLQDAATGAVIALPREFANPKPGGAAPSFAQLARTTVFQSAGLGDVGAGQILIHGGKRSPNGEFRPGRSRGALNPQSFQWEELRAPVFAEGFQELMEYQRLLPHPCLSPRRLTENMHVCPIAAVEQPAFQAREQRVEAILRDSQGNSATLLHPYHSRGRQGVEALLYHLEKSRLLFVAGRMGLGPKGLSISPTSLVFADGDTRWMLQPWVFQPSLVQPSLVQPSLGGDTGSPTERLPADLDLRAEAPLRRHVGELLDLLGELALVGRSRANAKLWQDLRIQSQALGLAHIPKFIQPASVLTLSAFVAFALFDGQL